MTAIFSHLQYRGLGGYLQKLCPKISNGNEEGASGQSTCKVQCADEALVLPGDATRRRLSDVKHHKPESEDPSLIKMAFYHREMIESDDRCFFASIEKASPISG